MKYLFLIAFILFAIMVLSAFDKRESCLLTNQETTVIYTKPDGEKLIAEVIR